ncbi:MAG: hypothetical protein ABWZ98_06840 [Nakamurella sp.]
MNDYAGTSHEAIYAMVKAGQPGQVNSYAGKVNGIRNRLGAHIAGLREQLAQLPMVWSDGAGSERLTGDLTAISEYLDVLANGLSGQPSSYSNLVTQAAADLSAALPPAVLPPPPPPGSDSSSLQSEKHESMMAMGLNPAITPGQTEVVAASYDAKIAQAEQARQLAGETATTLDNSYRTLLARLTPPAEPPATVAEAASTSPVAPPAGTGPAGDPAAMAGLAGGGTGTGGGSVDDFPTGAATPATLVSWAPVSAGSGLTGAVVAVPAAGQSEIPGFVGSGSVGSGSVGAGSANGGQLTGSWLDPHAVGADAVGTGSGVGWDDPLRSGLRTDPSAVTGGVWDASGSVLGGAQVQQAAGGSAGFPDGHDFDPISGEPVTTGAAAFPAANAGGGSSWETVAGAAGLAALAGGALYLARGGVGAANAGGLGAAGLAGLSGQAGGGMGPTGMPVTGYGAGGAGTGGVGGGSMGSSGAGGAGYGPGVPGSAGSAGSANGASAAGVRGAMGGANGSNSMVQGGQIGQAGRPTTGTAGYGAGRPAAPGSVIGGQQDHRVTWLVEDRDLYGIGPSVAAVIEVPVEPS